MTDSPKKKWRSIFLWTLGVLFVLVGVTAWIAQLDLETVDDADLRWSYRSSLSSQNGFAHLDIDFKGAVVVPSSSDDGDESALWDEMIAGDKWDDALAENVLKTNREVLGRVKQALEFPNFTFPAIESIGDNTHYLFQLRHLSSVLTVDVHRLARAGQFEEAATRALQILHLGRRMEGAQGALVHYLVGHAVASSGHNVLRTLVRRYPLPVEVIDRLAKRVAELSPDTGDFGNTLRVEYTVMADLLQQIGSGGAGGLDEIPRPLQRFAFIIYRPNETQEILARYFRDMLKLVEEGKPSRHLKDSIDVEALSVFNVVGKVILQLITIGEQFVDSAFESQLQHRGSVVFLAAERYRRREGSLPKSLDALTPKDLTAVPKDPFDKKAPLKYRDDGVVYSVGANGLDAGGIPRRKSGDTTTDSEEEDPTPTRELEVGDDDPSLELHDPKPAR